MKLLIFCLMGLELSTALLQQRLRFGQLAGRNLISFAWFSSPIAGQPLGLMQSRYSPQSFHRRVGAELERIERGEINRLEIEQPPRTGKTELAVRKFVPYIAGKHPERNTIVVTHTDTLAYEHGRDCRDVMLSPAYALAFPAKACELRGESRAMDRLQLRGGGVLYFTGRAGLGAGVGGDLMVFDDFFKNTMEAESVTVRNTAWRTYVADCESRLNNQKAPIVMIGTRRNEDDVQGRLFDPTNPHYDPGEASRWTRIRLPAMAEADDPLGREIDEPLWPEKFSASHYLARRNHRSDIIRIEYQTQDQCNPVALEGNYFKRRWLKGYQAAELPKHLRIYCASDHAYRKDQRNDRQCLLVVGIDASDTIWILPDTWWERATTDVLVEKILEIVATRHPFTWFAARDAISGSIGPFLHKRLREEKLYAFIDDEMREDKDLERRAQSIRNRAAMGMVRFPSFAPWWGQCEKELTAFPNGQHDDFVAALALLGMGLDKLVSANAPYTPSTTQPKPGTLAWVRKSSIETQAQEAAEKELKGW